MFLFIIVNFNDSLIHHAVGFLIFFHYKEKAQIILNLFILFFMNSIRIKIDPVTWWVEPVPARPIKIFSPKIDTDREQ